MKKSYYLIFLLTIIILSTLIWFYFIRIQNETIEKLVSASNVIPTKVLFRPRLPSIEEIFSNNHNWTQKLPKNRIRVLIATGDIIPAREVNYRSSSANNFNWPFEKTADFIKTGDITFINFETPLIESCPITHTGMVFCGDSRNIEGLLLAGVDVVSLANNHAGNYGEAGVAETIDLLQRNNILVTGVAGPIFKDVRGIKFAFLGYNDITKPQPAVSNVDEEKIKREIMEAKKTADIVVVTFHWGIEYRSQPDDRQIYLGRFAVDSGADLIIGNHPHWIQPLEFYKGKLISYAHGNFVFDQMWSLKTREGVVGRYTFYDDQLIDIEYTPVQIDDYGQPHFALENQKKEILNSMKEESFILSSSFRQPKL